MNRLLQIRTNIYYTKTKEEGAEEVYNKFLELVFLVDKPLYTKTSEGEVVRNRGVDEVRITVAADDMPSLIEVLQKYSTVDEKELH